MTRPVPSDERWARTRLPALAWLMLLLGLVLATYPAWRLLLIQPELPLDGLLRLRC